jgi:UDP-N-acetylmuramoyl-tripeptide--D-alanyl-D-alanine ligase
VIPTALAHVVAVTDAVVDGGSEQLRAALAAEVTGVATDSRQVGAGDLFVAIRGEHHDGHRFAYDAVAAGAVAVLADHALSDRDADRPVGVPVLVLPDPVVGLGRLAADLLVRLRRSGAPDVVGITGSVGKTSTKDLLASVLATVGPTVAPTGSYNNEIGLPATVLRCDEQTRYLVLELGSRGLGHIRALTQIAPPRIGVVLGVGSAHVGEFGSLEVTAQAKGELVEALPAAADGGVAVLNHDDPRVVAMAGRTRARVVTFGTSDDATVRATDVRLDEAARPRFRLHLGDAALDVGLQLHGSPSVTHALAVAAVASELGMPPEQITDALARAQSRSPGRMQVRVSERGVTVVDDAYNASPESVAAALRALVAINAAAGAGGAATSRDAAARRTWAVIGEMRELGASSVTQHREVGRLAARLGVSRLVAVGAPAATVLDGARETGRTEGLIAVPDGDAALDLLRAEVRPGDVVLVKASRAIGLDRVARALVEPALLDAVGEDAAPGRDES